MSSCFDTDGVEAISSSPLRCPGNYLSLPSFALPSMALFSEETGCCSLTSAPGVCGKTFASEALRRACKASWKD